MFQDHHNHNLYAVNHRKFVSWCILLVYIATFRFRSLLQIETSTASVLFHQMEPVRLERKRVRKWPHACKVSVFYPWIFICKKQGINTQKENSTEKSVYMRSCVYCTFAILETPTCHEIAYRKVSQASPGDCLSQSVIGRVGTWDPFRHFPRSKIISLTQTNVVLRYFSWSNVIHNEYLSIINYLSSYSSCKGSGQIRINPKLELLGRGIPLLNHHLRWPQLSWGPYTWPRHDWYVKAIKPNLNPTHVPLANCRMESHPSKFNQPGGLFFKSKGNLFLFKQNDRNI